MNPEIWKSFLSDTLRLCRDAEERLARFQEEPGPERVERFFETLHTLKGTCSMVRGCEGVTRILDGLEAELATQPPEESVRDPRWTERAASCIRKTRAHLEKMEIRRAAARTGAPRSDRGWLVRQSRQARDSLIWIPVTDILEVLDHRSVSGRDSIAWREGWIPVLRRSGSAAGREIGLVVRTERGVVVYAVDDVLGACSQEEALRRNVTSASGAESPEATGPAQESAA